MNTALFVITITLIVAIIIVTTSPMPSKYGWLFRVFMPRDQETEESDEAEGQ